MLKVKRIESETGKDAVIIKKGIIKKATDRNLIRRRIKHILREFKKEKKTGAFLVIVLSKELSNLSFKELKEKIVAELK